jgi:hypothetical protein
LLAAGALAAQFVARKRSLLMALAAGGLLSVPVNFLFLRDIAAPKILHLPYHHCVYDLLPRAPESCLGIAMYALGIFGVGWAGLVAWLGRHPDSERFRRGAVDRLLFLAGVGYTALLVFFCVEMRLS